MKTLKLALVAVVAAASILPMLSTPASARSHYYNRVYNRAYAPYGYGYGYGYSQYQANQAAANSMINQVNSMIQSGQISVQQGNQMLVQGHF